MRYHVMSARPRWVIAGPGLVAVAIGAVGLIRSDVSSTDRPTPTAVQRGEALFAAKGCASCHRAPDGSAPPSFVGVGPSLERIDERARARSDDPTRYLVESVLDPSAVLAPGWSGAYPSPQPGQSPMPVLPLSAGEIEDLVAYLLDGGDP